MSSAFKHFEGVGDEVQDGLEGFFYGFGAAGQVDYYGIPAYAADAAGQAGFFGFFEAFGAHELGQAGDALFYGLGGGFGGDVAAAEAGAAGGDDDADFENVAVM